MTTAHTCTLAITMGDPAGIGPEVVVKALSTSGILDGCSLLVVGDIRVLRAAARMTNVALHFHPGGVATPSSSWPEHGVAVLDRPLESLETLVPSRVSAAAGIAAVVAVERAADLALAGQVDAIVTAPLNKEAMRLAGYSHDGHTELLATRTGAVDVCMLLAGERLRVAHISGHRSLSAAAISPSLVRLQRVIELTKDAMQRLGYLHPRIAVAGLNPHAGEGGLFGREEIDVIGPAVATIAIATPDALISGPYPPDTVFRRAAAGEFDAVIAMYHDQGHIPIKMIEFDSAVNVTLGLPIIRTSPDHGTAFDIAGKGIANPANMIAAIRLAVRMVRRLPA